MSLDPQRDHDLLTRIDENVKSIKEGFKELEQRVSKVEHKVWYGAGIMVAGVTILELLLRK